MVDDLRRRAWRWFAGAGRRAAVAALLLDVAEVARLDADATRDPLQRRELLGPVTAEEARASHDHLLGVEVDMMVRSRRILAGGRLPARPEPAPEVESRVGDLAGAVTAHPGRMFYAGPFMLAAGPGRDDVAAGRSPRGRVLFGVWRLDGPPPVELVTAADVAGRRVACPRCGVRAGLACVDRRELAALTARLGEDRLARELALRGRDAIGSALRPSHAERVAAEERWWRGNKGRELALFVRVGRAERASGCEVERVADDRWAIDGAKPAPWRQAGARLWWSHVLQKAAEVAAEAFAGERGAGPAAARLALEGVGRA